MSAYAVSLTAPPEGGARGSHLPSHVGRGAGDLSQAWSSQTRRSGDLRASFAAVDGPLRRLRERDGANVRSSGITLKTRRSDVTCDDTYFKTLALGEVQFLLPRSHGRSNAHQVLSSPTRTTPSGPRVTTGRYLEASDLPRVAAIMPRVCSRMGPHGSTVVTMHLTSSRPPESRPRDGQQPSFDDRASSSQAYGRHHYRRWSRSQRDKG